MSQKIELSQLRLAIEKIEQAKKRGIEVKIHSDSIHVSPADPKGPRWFFYFQTLSELMVFFEVFDTFINNGELYEHVGELRTCAILQCSGAKHGKE